MVKDKNKLSQKGTSVPNSEIEASHRSGSRSGSTSINSEKLSLSKLDSKVAKGDGSEEQDPYRHLSPEEMAIVKRQLDIPEVNLGYWDLFRYADGMDKFLLISAGLAAIAAGAILPLMTVVFGSLSGVFQKYTLHQMPPDEFQDKLNSYTLYATPAT